MREVCAVRSVTMRAGDVVKLNGVTWVPWSGWRNHADQLADGSTGTVLELVGSPAGPAAAVDIDGDVFWLRCEHLTAA